MGATATLSTMALVVAPGAEARCDVKVRNTSHVVEEMTFTILGDPAAWARVEPARLQLFPGTDGVVSVIFAPPAGAEVAARVYDFAVKVNPKEDPEGSAVEEGTVEVVPAIDSALDLAPRTSKGRISGKHDLAIDNRGNAPFKITWRGAHADNLLEFEFDPPSLIAEAGTATFAKVKVKPKKNFWRGPSKSFPFEVMAEGEGQQLTGSGIFVQDPILPKWILRLLALLMVLGILLFVLYQTALKPVIRSQAKNAALKEVEATQRALGLTKDDVEAFKNDPSKVGSKTGAADVSAAEAGKKKAEDAAAAANAAAADAKAELARLRTELAKDQVNVRLTATVAANETGQAVFEIPEKSSLNVTDIVFQNPFADSGFLRIKQDDRVLIEINMDNFRDLDYHFVTGTPFKEKEKLVLEVDCKRADAQECKPSIYVTGDKPSPPPAAPTTTKAP